MPFRSARGLKGKVYVPEQQESDRKKHSCQDCYACQMCSDERCNVCMRQELPHRCDHGHTRRKLRQLHYSNVD